MKSKNVVKRFISLALGLAMVFGLFAPTAVLADTSNGYMEHGVGTEWQTEYIRYTNKTHHPISLNFRQYDIPQSPQHYRSFFTGGSVVFFADAPTTLTLVHDIWWSDGGMTTEWVNNNIIQELILPSDITLMEYLKPSYEFWTTEHDEGGREMMQRLQDVERRPVPFDNVQLREISEEMREWLQYWLSGLDNPEEAGEAILAGASVTLPEGIFLIRTSGYSSVPTFVLVVGSADTSVLQAYNQESTTTPPTTAPNLSTASTWAHESITNAVTAGLVPQNLQSNYTNNITRAEFTALAVNLYETITGREIEGRITFADTTDINVQKAAYIGVVSGTGGNNFSPNMQFNREQAAVIVSRLAYAIGQPLPQVAAAFADNAQISSWAIEQAGQAQAAGIMGGVGNNVFNPQGVFSREQSIIAILRLFEALS